MIISEIMGGLGNQLFQYAAARTVAMNNNSILKLDLSWYNNSNSRPYLLNAFNTSPIEASINEIKHLKEITIKKLLQKFILKNNNYKYIDKSTGFDKKFEFIQNNTYMSGYYQSEKYFTSIEHIIRKEFCLKKPISTRYNDVVSKIQTHNSISLHIRRGDYHAINNILSLNYYYSAIEIMGNLLNKQLLLIAFSDDIDWAKKNLFVNYPIIFIDGGNDFDSYEEMYLMSICKHNIIANSSFSWWGAWLNNNPQKIVIAPATWHAYSNTILLSQKDIVPESWICI